MIRVQEENWWQEVFDQKYIDTYEDIITLSQTEKEVDFLVRLFRRYEVQSVVDVACGYGRHSIPLARRGFSITGIDQSEYFIAKAKSGASGATFIRDDIRYFRLAEKFDAAINMFTSFGYFHDDEENQKALDNIGRSLKSGGVFVLDNINPNVLVRRVAEGNRKKRNTLSNGIILTTEEHIHGKTWVIKRSWDSQSYVAYIRLFVVDEIKEMLERAGFKIHETFGSFDGDSFDAERSLRCIIVSKKLWES